MWIRFCQIWLWMVHVILHRMLLASPVRSNLAWHSTAFLNGCIELMFWIVLHIILFFFLKHFRIEVLCRFSLSLGTRQVWVGMGRIGWKTDACWGQHFSSRDHGSDASRFRPRQLEGYVLGWLKNILIIRIKYFYSEKYYGGIQNSLVGK